MLILFKLHSFFRIRTEYGEIRSISLYSVRMRENARKMRTTITPNTETFYTVLQTLKRLQKIQKIGQPY